MFSPSTPEPISQSLESAVEEINQTAFSVFGLAPSGALRVRWFRTHALSYFIEDGEEAPQFNGTLWVPSPAWRQYPWSVVLGDGWVVARWVPPIPRDLHVAKYGQMCPWPNEGEYVPIENLYSPLSDPPSLKASLLIRKLLLDMETVGCSLLTNPDSPSSAADAEAAASAASSFLLSQQQRQNEERLKQTEAEIEDALPAFLPSSGPGRRGGDVSFGGVEAGIINSTAKEQKS